MRRLLLFVLLAMGPLVNGLAPARLLIERDDVFRTLHVEYFDAVRFPHLICIDDRPDTLTQVLAARGG